MKNVLISRVNKRGIPATAVAIFYTCLCVFSLFVGMYCFVTGTNLSQMEISAETSAQIKELVHMPIPVFFGMVTFVVGIVQGITAYCLLVGKRKICWIFAIAFTVFSLLSCSSKLLVSISAFAVVKSLAYILALIAILVKRTRTNYRSPRQSEGLK